MSRLLMVQYPDLTEIARLWDYDEGYITSLKDITTEFVFYIGPPGHKEEQVRDIGLAPISAMNNWWPSHCNGARKLTLYWAKNPYWNPYHPVLPWRNRWCHSNDPRTNDHYSITKNLAGGGCGFKIGEPPFRVSLFNQFFTLMRMPVQPSKANEQRLLAHNYKHVATGAHASYYVNGWSPETYDKDAEFAHFNITEEWWKKNGAIKYGNR